VARSGMYLQELTGRKGAGRGRRHACRHELYRDRYQHTKQRLGKQRGAKVAQVD
jgi:hypothetical protein